MISSDCHDFSSGSFLFCILNINSSTSDNIGSIFFLISYFLFSCFSASLNFRKCELKKNLNLEITRAVCAAVGESGTVP